MEAVDTSRHVTERMVCKWLLQLMTTVHTAHRHYITLGAIDVTDVLLISGIYQSPPPPPTPLCNPTHFPSATLDKLLYNRYHLPCCVRIDTYLLNYIFTLSLTLLTCRCAAVADDNGDTDHTVMNGLASELWDSPLATEVGHLREEIRAELRRSYGGTSKDKGSDQRQDKGSDRSSVGVKKNNEQKHTDKGSGPIAPPRTTVGVSVKSNLTAPSQVSQSNLTAPSQVSQSKPEPGGRNSPTGTGGKHSPGAAASLPPAAVGLDRAGNGLLEDPSLTQPSGLNPPVGAPAGHSQHTYVPTRYPLPSPLTFFLHSLPIQGPTTKNISFTPH